MVRIDAIGWLVGITWLSGVLLPAQAEEPTWAEKLGYPKGKVVLMLHADDIGMCYEANESAKESLPAKNYHSAAIMMPCPWVTEIIDWHKSHPKVDLGLHLAMNSEWKYYRWGPVAPKSKVPGMLDAHGFLHREVRSTATLAKPSEVEAEIRAQVKRAFEFGLKPTHIDTHMGCLYARPDFTEAYMKVAVEYRIPAMVIEMTPHTVAKFRKQGYPIDERMVKLCKGYPLPKLDDFHAVLPGKTYEEKLQNFYAQVRAMRPGLQEIIFHPAKLTEGLRHITGTWQQRAWEDRMFADPEVKDFLEREGIIFTDWIEIMKRFDERFPTKK